MGLYLKNTGWNETANTCSVKPGLHSLHMPLFSGIQVNEILGQLTELLCYDT